MQPLIQANGQPRLGVFDVPPAQVNYRDYDLRSPKGRRQGALARRSRTAARGRVCLRPP